MVAPQGAYTDVNARLVALEQLRRHGCPITDDDLDHAVRTLFRLVARGHHRPRFADWEDAWPLLERARHVDALPIGTEPISKRPRRPRRGRRR